jgi:hypothetical protein
VRNVHLLRHAARQVQHRSSAGGRPARHVRRGGPRSRDEARPPQPGGRHVA